MPATSTAELVGWLGETQSVLDLWQKPWSLDDLGVQRRAGVQLSERLVDAIFQLSATAAQQPLIKDDCSYLSFSVHSMFVQSPTAIPNREVWWGEWENLAFFFAQFVWCCPFRLAGLFQCQATRSLALAQEIYQSFLEASVMPVPGPQICSMRGSVYLPQHAKEPWWQAYHWLIMQCFRPKHGCVPHTPNVKQQSIGSIGFTFWNVQGNAPYGLLWLTMACSSMANGMQWPVALAVAFQLLGSRGILYGEVPWFTKTGVERSFAADP